MTNVKTIAEAEVYKAAYGVVQAANGKHDYYSRDEAVAYLAALMDITAKTGLLTEAEIAQIKANAKSDFYAE